MKERISHGVIAVLFALGLTLAMLGCLGLTGQAWIATAILVPSVALLTACSARKTTRIAAWGAVGAGTLVWLFLLGGVNDFVEILRAITLHFSGLHTALPMVAEKTAVFLAVFVGVAAYALTGRGIGAYPALAVLLLVVVMLWLGDQPRMMLFLIPSVAGVIALSSMDRHEGMALRRVLPLALVAAAVSFLLVPAGGVTIDPLKEAADTLRQKIFDYFFFTEPRNVFTLAAEGYYPQGQNQLGGPANPTEHHVMTVRTPRKTYLRGSVKNVYTGRVWVDSTAGRRYLWLSPRWTDVRNEAFNAGLPKGTLGESSSLLSQQLSVRMMDSNSSSMFVPQRIRELSPGGDLVPYFNKGSEVFATRDLQKGDTYTVTAPLPVAGDAGLGTLIAAASAEEDPAYAQILSDYTALPEHLQTQVFELAHLASAGAETPYDKAFAIQNYLSRNFRYTLDAEPQPENIDFVSNFLLNTKEGYCTYFASAMTVLCRMVGLPARYVEGYLAEPDANGVAYVTGMQGHAWTEVYFSGFGWLTFDATPPQNNAVPPPEAPPENEPPQEQPTPEPENEAPPEEEILPTPTPETPDDLPEDEPNPQADDADEPNPPPPFPWWLLILLLILALLGAAAARMVLTQPARKALRAVDERERWQVWVQALHDALRIQDLPRKPSESPMAYMARLDRLKRFPAELLPIGECMALVFYGRITPEPEETAMTAAAYAAVVQRMDRWQRAKLTLMRAFTKESKRSFAK